MSCKKACEDDEVRHIPLLLEVQRPLEVRSSEPTQKVDEPKYVQSNKNAFFRKNQPSYCPSPLEKLSAPPSLPTDPANPIDCYVIIIQAHEKIDKEVSSLFQASMRSTEQNIIETSRKYKTTVEKLDNTKSKTSLFTHISDAGSLAGSVTSMVVGITLLATGAVNPLQIIGGVALILSSLTSISAFIFRKSNAPTPISLSVEIAGGILGLVSGGVSIGLKVVPAIAAGTTILKALGPAAPLAVKIGTGLLHASSHSTRAIASVYRKESGLTSAQLKALDGALSKNQQGLELKSSLIKQLSNNYRENTFELIDALQKELQINQKIINSNLRG